MKHHLILLLLTIGITACQHSETVHIPLGNKQWLVKEYPDRSDTTTYLRKFYFDNEMKKLGTEGLMKESNKHGLWKWWYRNGKLKCQTIYDHGIPIKEGQDYYESGDLKLLRNYSNRGADSAYYEYFHPNGQLWVRGFWNWNGNEDIEEGSHKEWYPNGALQMIGQYENNQVYGTWIWYNSTGSETKRTIFKKGKQKDSLGIPPTYSEHIARKLKPIRKKLRPLLNRQEWSAIDKRKVETENVMGTAVYFFLNTKLRKIRLLQHTDSTDRFVEYYLDSKNLLFVFERLTDNYQLKNDPEYYEPFEDSLFFESCELISIKSNLDCGAPFADDYKKEEQDRLKAEFEKLKKSL